MDSARTAVEELPGEFPIFPLSGALLLPHGKLPLNIFEPRYKALVEDALAGQRLFGMIQADGSRAPDSERLFGVGCLGRLTSFSETGDGRYLIALTGVIRFRVQAEIAGRRGYRRVAADLDRFRLDLEPPPASLPQRTALLAALRGYFANNGFDANWSAIEGMADAELVSTLCMVCPFSVPEKQALLEATDAAARADTLVALLQMGAHGPADAGRSLS